jgi:hypothetical protein
LSVFIKLKERLERVNGMTAFLMSYSDIKEQHKTATCILFLFLFYFILYFILYGVANMTKQQVLSGALQQPHLTKSDAIVFLLNSLSFLRVWTGFQFRKASATSRIFHHMNK